MAIRACKVSRLLGFIINVYVVSATTYTQVKWFQPRRANNYVDFGSVSIVDFKVPEKALESQWQFHGYASDNQCPEKVLNVSLLYGSIPAINPRNEKFPDNFNLNKTDFYSISVNTSKESVFFSIKSPKAGLWFGLVYLVDPLDERMVQKGLGGLSCSYQVGGIHMIEAYQDLDELMTGDSVELTFQYDKEASDQIYRFHSTKLTWKYTVEISKCKFTATTGLDNSTTDCPFRFNTGDVIPKSSNGVDCSKEYVNEKCSQTVISPATDSWIYFSGVALEDGNVTFTILITLDNCGWYSNQHTINEEPATKRGTPTLQGDNNTLYNETIRDINQLSSLLSNVTFNKLENNFETEDLPNITILNSSTVCSTVPELGRYVWGATSTISYGLRYGSIPFPNRIIVRDWDSLTVPFELLSKTDAGGTLSVEMDLKNDLINETDNQTVVVDACIQLGRIPIDGDGVICGKDHIVELDSSGNFSKMMYFPYPKPGTWFITMRAKCLEFDEKKNEMTKVPCKSSQALVQFAVEINQCVHGECGIYGARDSCNIRRSLSVVYSVCKCIAGYRGYGCTDDTEALSDGLQLLATFLLTLSNLCFIPAIIVCLMRGYYIEAFIYFYNMFFSTFYHACDANSYAKYCMMPYHVMIHCDFLGSILSFWTTIITMAKLKFEHKSFLLTFGVLIIAIGVTKDRHDIWTFLAPVLIASVILGVSWGHKMYKRKSCYPPSKKRWLLYILPGVLIAGTGLLCFALFETHKTYQYVHSVWHTCMALCVVFLLPPKPSKKTDFGATGSDVNGLDLETVSSSTSGTYSQGINNPTYSSNKKVENGNTCPL